MAEKNTPLINELLTQINNHPDFEQWQSQGRIPATIIEELCEPLKTDPLYGGQTSRFYVSAIKLIKYIYKSWLKLQQQRQYKLEGQERWLSILKSDTELLTECECSLDILRKKAKEVLFKIESNIKKSKKKQPPKKSSLLFNRYDKAEDILTRSAICYLLKNGSKLPKTDNPENSRNFAQRRRKTVIKIERLREQIEGSRPHGRDLTDDKWLETLITAASKAPENEKEVRLWQDAILKRPKSLPFPIIFETNEDLKWHKNEKGRLCVRFHGLSKHTFQVYCDRRQLHWFQRFLEDQQIKKEGKDSHSSSLFTLRSTTLVWKKGKDKDKDKPWNFNHLILYCSIDTRLWTNEGTDQVLEQKRIKYTNNLLSKKPVITFPLFFRTHKTTKFLEIWKIVTCYQFLKLHKKVDLEKAKKDQQKYLKSLESCLRKIHQPYFRPSKPIYQGKPNIVLGVAMGLQQPATVAIVDRVEQKGTIYRNIKQLLGKNYQLLNRHRQKKQKLSYQRHKNQKRSGNNQLGESKLGQHLDRLIAKAIVELAKKYQASVIVVPKLEDMREIVQSEVKAKAEDKIPGNEELQKKYAKQYRINIHNWSYGRLIESITTQANKLGILIKEAKQPVRGSPTEKAQEIAITGAGTA